MRFLLTISLLSLSILAFGQATFNSNGTGAWTTSGSWTIASGSDADGLPDADDTVVILSTHVITLSSSTTQACSSLTIQASGTLTVSGASSDLDITNTLTVSSSTATFNISGSSATVDASDMTLSAGSVNVSDGTLNLSSGTGGLTMSGGTFALTGSSTFTVTEGIIISGGTFRPNATGTLVTTGDSLEVATGGTLDHNNGTINVGTDLTLRGTFTFDEVSAGTSTISCATLTQAAGTSTLNGDRLNVIASSGDGLIISGGTFRMQDDVIVTVDADALISGGTWELRATGSNRPTYNSGGSLTVSSGSLDHDAGSINLGTTSTLTISGGTFSMDQALGSDPEANINGNNLTISGGTAELLRHSVAEFTGDLTVNGSQSIDISCDFQVDDAIINGTINIIGNDGSKFFNDVTVNSGGNWNVTTDEIFNITGNIVNNGTWTGCSTTSCDYQLGVPSPTTASGTISGSGAMTAMGNINIFNANQTYTNTNTGGITVTTNLGGDGTFINGTNGRLEYAGSGNFTIAGFDASATGNTMVFSGTSDQNLRSTNDTDNNYYNIIINKSSGEVDMLSTVRLDSDLTLTSGNLNALDFDLLLTSGSSITGGSTSSYIQLDDVGQIRREFSSNDTFIFPIGTGTDYLPLTLEMTSATYGSGSYIELDLDIIAHPSRDVGNMPTGDDEGTAATDYLSIHYTFTPNNITSPFYNATYRYATSHVTGTESNMVPALYRLHPAPSVNILDWFSNGTVNPVTNTVSFERADAFGDLYAMDQTLERLPVELVSFYAEAVEQGVHLVWETATEENNAGFLIERGTNPSDFQTISSIPGKGNSLDLEKYLFIDKNPIYGRAYYRLKQIDFNGLFEYSEIISVFSEPPSQFQVFPNPVQRGRQITIVLPDKPNPGSLNHISLISQTGALSFESEQENTSHSIVLPIPSQISPGLYYLQLRREGALYRKQILIR